MLNIFLFRGEPLINCCISSYTNTTPDALVSNMRIGKLRGLGRHACSLLSDLSQISFATSLFTVAVSATLPNLGQLASFVESGEAYTFDESYRPVPLKTYVRACGRIGNNRYLFDKSLSQLLGELFRLLLGMTKHDRWPAV